MLVIIFTMYIIRKNNIKIHRTNKQKEVFSQAIKKDYAPSKVIDYKQNTKS